MCDLLNDDRWNQPGAMMKSRGEKVAPAETEQVIGELDGVLEVAVVVEGDAVRGQAVVARIVRSDPALRFPDVVRHCESRLEDSKVPTRIEFVEKLAKTSTGESKR